MHRGAVHQEQVESRIKVLKSAAFGSGELESKADTLGNTQKCKAEEAQPVFATKKRKAPDVWPALALEKLARQTSAQ